MMEMIKNESNAQTKPPKINVDEVAEIIYTSGSLGRAKGVMLSTEESRNQLNGI